jgi:UPF0716 protein FxsA
MPIFLLLLIVPLVEIAAFIVIGGQIGVATTLILTLVTAIIGTTLLRSQGLAIVQQIRQELEANRIPARQLADGAMIAVAGILLLTPGFVTDSVGFALFVPAFRSLVWRQIGKRLDITVTPAGERETRHAKIIELDEDEFSADGDPHSPWRDGRE